jgi:hypothetical protein
MGVTDSKIMNQAWQTGRSRSESEGGKHAQQAGELAVITRMILRF